MHPRDFVGRLKTVGGMKQSTLNNKPCNIDAALVTPGREYTENKFWQLGYINELPHVEGKVGDGITKCGRTTGVTSSTIAAVNVSANIGGLGWGVATIEGAIQSRTAFVQGGDSGSRVWKTGTAEPIGIVFAGSWLTSLIIPAQTVCDAFGVTFSRDEGNPHPINGKKSLLRRIWEWIKNLFRR